MRLFRPDDREQIFDSLANIAVAEVAKKPGLDQLWPMFLICAQANLDNRARYPHLAHSVRPFADMWQGIQDVLWVRSPQKRQISGIIRGGLRHSFMSQSALRTSGFTNGVFDPNTVAQRFMQAVGNKPRDLSALVGVSVADSLVNEAQRNRELSLDLGGVRLDLKSDKSDGQVIFKTYGP